METDSRSESVIVGGFKVTRRSRQRLTDLIVETVLLAGDTKPSLLFDINGHALALAKNDPVFRDALNQADILHLDSEPLVKISRWMTNTPVEERSATTDLFYDFSEAFAARQISCYFLGATDEVLQTCSERMRSLYPDLKIVGMRNGYFAREEIPEIVAAINATGADVLWVGMGKPREQIFSLDIREHFKGKWIVTCGGCFDFAAGNYKRAPLFVQKIGLEWLHRLILRPRALFWRYLTTNPVAIYLALRHSREL